MPDYDAIIKAVENDKPLPKNVINTPDVKESHTSYINRMQELNERIAQLTELVNTGTKTLESLEETLKTVEKERDRLADRRREQEPQFERGSKFEPYWSIQFENAFAGGASICKRMEHGENYYDDMTNFKYNNYFKTVQRAEEIADKINFLLKLERLHDTFCPDYVPNFDDYSYKYMIYCDHNDKIYKVMSCYSAEYRTLAYFPSEEIAQKVCDILNAELEDEI